MYYYNNDKIFVQRLPKNIIKPDGSLFLDFNQADKDTISDYGYYFVRRDNSTPPTPNSVELYKQRQIVLDKPYVDVTRVWQDPIINNISIIQKP